MSQKIARCCAALALAAMTALFGRAMAGVNEPAPYAWQTIPFGGGGFIDGFVYHPKQKDILYARTDIGGLYRFDFAAKRWLPLLDHTSRANADLMGVLAVALDPNDANKVYAACGLYIADWARKGAILRSSDRGKTWQQTDLPVNIGGNADGRGTGERLAVDPRHSEVIYYGSNRDGLWKSSDGGQHFAAAASPAKAISFVFFDAKTGEMLLGSADGKGALYTGKDGAFARAAATPDMVPQRAAVAPDGSLYVSFAGSSATQAVNPSFAETGAVWKRDTAGIWHDVTPVKPGASGKFGYSGIDVGPDGTVAVSTLDRWHPGDDIFVSTDGGANWSGLEARARHDTTPYPWLTSFSGGKDRMGHWIADLKINPFNANEMIYGTGFGAWMTGNLHAMSAPVLFDFAVANLEETATLQLVSPPSGARVLAAFGDIGGGGWSDLTKTPDAILFQPNTENNSSVDYAGLKPLFVVRVVNNSPTHAFLSQDGGLSWSAIASSPYSRPKDGEPWRGPGAMAVSAGATALVWAPEKQAAVYSTDMGKSWAKSNGWPTGGDQMLIPVSDKTVNGVFYVLDRPSMRVLISTDGGASFSPIITGLPAIEGWQTAQLAVTPGHLRDLWIAAPFGLIHSKDANSAVVNCKDVQAAYAVGFGAPKIAGGYPAIYLAGKVKNQDGLWRSDDGGISWTRINDDAHQFGYIGAVSGDMRDYGTIYIAAGGRGLIAGKPAP